MAKQASTPGRPGKKPKALTFAAAASAEPSPPPFVRNNGWKRPFDNAQLAAWFFFAYFGLVYFGVVAQACPTRWRAAAVTLVGVLYGALLALYVVCCTLDPADPNIFTGTAPRKNKALDRSKRSHVIETHQCYLCAPPRSHPRARLRAHTHTLSLSLSLSLALPLPFQ